MTIPITLLIPEYTLGLLPHWEQFLQYLTVRLNNSELEPRASIKSEWLAFRAQYMNDLEDSIRSLRMGRGVRVGQLPSKHIAKPCDILYTHVWLAQRFKHPDYFIRKHKDSYLIVKQ